MPVLADSHERKDAVGDEGGQQQGDSVDQHLSQAIDSDSGTIFGPLTIIGSIKYGSSSSSSIQHFHYEAVQESLVLAIDTSRLQERLIGPAFFTADKWHMALADPSSNRLVERLQLLSYFNTLPKSVCAELARS